jgi:hypothetical protein
MLRIFVALAFLCAGLVATTGTVAAAPDNKNTSPFPVNCEGYGDILVTEMTRGGGPNDRGSPVVFGPDGKVFIAKEITGSAELTFSIEGGPSIDVQEDSDELSVPGKGFRGRLTDCSFTESFEEEFVADQGVIDFLESQSGQQLDQYLGATVHVVGAFSGIAEVLIPAST